MNWVVHTLVVAAAELVDPIEELPSQVLEVMQTEQEVTVEQDQVVIELSSEIKIKSDSNGNGLHSLLDWYEMK